MSSKTQSNEFIDEQQGTNVQDRSKSVPRHPRWTRQETMILIEGKQMAEERARTKTRRSNWAFGPNKPELKWDSISSYCRQNGVNRGSVQCRKRWGNLVCDFKKIKAWESSELKEGFGSFWLMRSELRRERKLPGFFDRDVYEVLDGNTMHARTGYELALVTTSHVDDENKSDGVEGECEEEEAQETMFQEFEDDAEKENEEKEEKEGVKGDKASTIPSPVPISEIRCQSFHQTYSCPGVGRKTPPSPPYFCRESEFQERVKRRRRSASSSECPNVDLVNHLVEAVERNHSLLKEWVEVQKINHQLEIDQRKEHHENLQSSLDKIADALMKIANSIIKDN